MTDRPVAAWPKQHDVLMCPTNTTSCHSQPTRIGFDLDEQRDPTPHHSDPVHRQTTHDDIQTTHLVIVTLYTDRPHTVTYRQLITNYTQAMSNQSRQPHTATSLQFNYHYGSAVLGSILQNCITLELHVIYSEDLLAFSIGNCQRVDHISSRVDDECLTCTELSSAQHQHRAEQGCNSIIG